MGRYIIKELLIQQTVKTMFKDNYIKDPRIKELIKYSKSIRKQVFEIRGIITPNEYRKKYINDVIHGQENNARANISGTKPERKVRRALDQFKITYKKEFKIIGHYYDFYLIDENVLIEVDGEFWHPKMLSEAKYNAQKKNYFNDIVKTAIAKAKKIPLIRLRESYINEASIDDIGNYIVNNIETAKSYDIQQSKTDS